MDDIKKLAKEVLEYLDHGKEPYIEKVNWLAFDAAPVLARKVLEQAEQVQVLREAVEDMLLLISQHGTPVMKAHATRLIKARVALAASQPQEQK